MLAFRNYRYNKDRRQTQLELDVNDFAVVRATFSPDQQEKEVDVHTFFFLNSYDIMCGFIDFRPPFIYRLKRRIHHMLSLIIVVHKRSREVFCDACNIVFEFKLI